jgi:hypothetical protein
MEGSKEPPGLAGEPVEEALGRLLPALTEGMAGEEAGKAREILAALFTLRSAEQGPDRAGEEIAKRLKMVSGLSLEGRRRMLQEDALALEVLRLTGQVSGTAERVLRGELQITPDLKKETRRTLARLGQLNAVLVGRYPHLTPLLERVSEAYLDAMFILGDGKGPASIRLQGLRKDRERAGKKP